jgi:hypothetical protein
LFISSFLGLKICCKWVTKFWRQRQLDNRHDSELEVMPRLWWKTMLAIGQFKWEKHFSCIFWLCDFETHNGRKTTRFCYMMLFQKINNMYDFDLWLKAKMIVTSLNGWWWQESETMKHMIQFGVFGLNEIMF